MMSGPARGIGTAPADHFTTVPGKKGAAMPPEPTPAPEQRQFREDNPNWRGGRSVTPNGYVLIRVGVGHPMADVRGYAYEHRHVMAEKIGRPLEPGEIVHHINGNKQDNRPENLELVAGHAEHFVRHRKADKGLRLPGEPNPTVACACGCGEEFLRYDEAGRPRSYISGHNPHPAPTEAAVLEALGSSPVHRDEVALATGKDVRCVAVALSKLKRKGLAFSLGGGIWSRKGA